MASAACVEGVDFVDGLSIEYLREAPGRLTALKQAYSLTVGLCTVVIIALEAES
jgi:hypothetical protein